MTSWPPDFLTEWCQFTNSRFHEFEIPRSHDFMTSWLPDLLTEWFQFTNSRLHEFEIPGPSIDQDLRMSRFHNLSKSMVLWYVAQRNGCNCKLTVHRNLKLNFQLLWDCFSKWMPQWITFPFTPKLILQLVYLLLRLQPYLPNDTCIGFRICPARWLVRPRNKGLGRLNDAIWLYNKSGSVTQPRPLSRSWAKYFKGALDHSLHPDPYLVARLTIANAPYIIHPT